DAEFERDHDLPDRLPFDILFESANIGLTPVYEEGDSYTSMASGWETLTEYNIRVDRSRGGRFLTLLQRWPGDIDNPHPDQFFEFQIDREILGVLKIQYRKSPHPGGYTGFVLKDTGNPEGNEIKGKYVEVVNPLPPMQRGDL
ncbi:MAG: hypothetical protein KDA84_29995, partial [Planctomycetaceae bacterium]|nr:hypothetical protein [Planctomycetaceae bacterium]